MPAPDTTIDIGALIDERPLSRFQQGILLLCGAAAVLDGWDTFSIGVAAPSIAAKIGMPLSGLGAVFSSALLGAAVGAAAFGPLADRFGRKRLLVAALILFGLFTAATARADSVAVLLAVRFLAGVGLGGATPSFLALASEYAPSRIRATVTSALWAGFPLGGMLGGFLNAWLVGAFDWPSLFYVGGALPLLLAPAIAWRVPESLRFLVARGAPADRLRPILARLAPEHGPALPARSAAPAPGLPVRALFADGRAANTVLVWVPFFLAFGVLAIVVLWTPSLLRQQGMSAAAAATVVGFHGLGGFLGMAVAGRLLELCGPIRALAPAFVVGSLVTAALGTVGQSVPAAALCDGLVGLFVGIGASGMIGFSALIYPTTMRSSGIGAALAMGRVGQVCAPLAVAAMVQAGWSIPDMFLWLAAAPLAAAAAVPLVQWTRPLAGALRPAPASRPAAPPAGDMAARTEVLSGTHYRHC